MSEHYSQGKALALQCQGDRNPLRPSEMGAHPYFFIGPVPGSRIATYLIL